MNIGIFTDTYAPSINGIVTSIRTFKQELEKKGHLVFVFCPTYQGQKRSSRIRERNERIFRYRSFTYPRLKEYRIALPVPPSIRRIRKLGLDVIHFHTPFTMGLLAMYVSKRLGIPLIQTYHTHIVGYVHYVPFPKPLMRRLARWGTRVYCDTCSLVISPSSQILRELESYGVTTRLAVLPTGVEHGVVPRNGTAALGPRFGIPDKTKVLVSVGRLGKEKNFTFLVRMFARLHAERPDTVFVVIGDGPERERLEQYARSLGIGDSIRFLGYRTSDEVHDLLRLADLFVFASLTETQGLSLLEALSEGTPADALGVTDILGGNESGGILVNGDESLFADKVKLLLDDRSLYDAAKEAARKTASRFSPDTLTETLLRHYSEASVSA